MAAAPERIEPSATAPPSTPPDLLDTLLAGRQDKPLEPVTGAIVVAVPHPLEGVEDVAKAAEVIGHLLVADKEAKGIRIYPRRILRQQHIAAFMLVNPFASTTEICAFFNIGVGSLSNIVKSDTFKALVSAHKISLETSLGADLQDQLRQTLQVSLEVVQSAVTRNQDPEFALAVLDKTANRLGMGAKHNTHVQINNNIVTPEMIALARARRLGNAP